MLLLLLDKEELTKPSGPKLLYRVGLRIQSGLVRNRYSLQIGACFAATVHIEHGGLKSGARKF